MFLLTVLLLFLVGTSFGAYAVAEVMTTDEQIVQAIQNGTGEIELTIGSVKLRQPIVIPAGKKVILTGEGHIQKDVSAPSLMRLIEVQKDGELTLKGKLTVDGANEAMSGIWVEGTLILRDDVSITRFSSEYHQYPVKVEGGRLVMEGGSVHHNTLYETSAVEVINGEMQMIAGSIRDNAGEDGTPGIYLSNSTMVMGDGSSNPMIANNVLKGGSSVGGGLCVHRSDFIMYSGTIQGNRGVNGGGIGVYCDANGGRKPRIEIVKGTICHNWAIMGGGIHITEHGSSAVLKNAAIYENQTFAYASHDNGGGVWFCPEGSGRFYATNGSAILGNTAGTAGDDITIDDMGILPDASETSHREGSVKLSQRTFTGIPIGWYKDEKGARYRDGKHELAQAEDYNGSQRAELHGVIENRSALSEVVAYADVLIYGNTAAIGAGISCNGVLVIGEEGKDQTVQVLKKWNDKDHEDQRPKQVVVKLLQNEEELDCAVLSEENHWKVTFDELPAYDPDGLDYRYDIVEEIQEGYENYISSERNGNTISFVLENRYTVPEKPKDPPPNLEDLPKTGDSSNLAGVIALLCASCIGLAGLSAARKKR